MGVNLRVTKRLLWVGDAVYPLQNIARVYVFLLHPERKRAVFRFLKRLTIASIVLLVISLSNDASPGADDTGGSQAAFMTLGFAVLCYLVVDLVSVLLAQPHHVLAIETNGNSTALIAGSNLEALRRLTQDLAYAIENPGTEFQVRVETLNINPRSYQFGDNVNMYGGANNVGIAR
ncbi:DUF6232 family protein [Streptomyces sp. IB201691-2A2]|uniref:DUF6232 family protein n=1 Tax=Streptomyces sp. IB201691-2A2 TaxID=2561920 RepID=UPI00117DACD0|nr:DUF6232 family protein [Streptomyces sp. IB201691-2A2]TRO62389.1 hypothetical protein E4K73_23835 [Streptomyces sp. IB201691-2A2]